MSALNSNFILEVNKQSHSCFRIRSGVGEKLPLFTSYLQFLSRFMRDLSMMAAFAMSKLWTFGI